MYGHTTHLILESCDISGENSLMPSTICRSYGLGKNSKNSMLVRAMLMIDRNCSRNSTSSPQQP